MDRIDIAAKSGKKGCLLDEVSKQEGGKTRNITAEIFSHAFIKNRGIRKRTKDIYLLIVIYFECLKW